MNRCVQWETQCRLTANSPIYHKCYRFQFGKSPLNLPTSRHRRRRSAGTGPWLPLQLRSSWQLWSTSEKNRTNWPSLLVSVREAVFGQMSCGVTLHQRHFDPMLLCPITQNFSFQIIWLQGSTQNNPEKNKRNWKTPSYPPNMADNRKEDILKL